MIGVVARPEDRDVVREFFELFKTPWELCRGGGRYEVLVHADPASGDHPPAKLAFVYGSQATAWDHERSILPGHQRANTTLSCHGDRLPVYGSCVTLPSDSGSPHLALEDTREPVASVTRADGRTVVRVGYDLFREIRFLLTAGQPPVNAGIPALERHVAFLRDWIVRSGIALVEIPPVPEGYRFIVCLTHDVDHPSIRLHRFDHTMFGFLYRAVVGSLIGACRGRTQPAALRCNLKAALALPFVHLGLARDFWAGFDGYLEIEKGLGSTFFVIPARNRPGRTAGGPAPRRRASSYGVSDIADRVRALHEAGCEVGLHGIDAWLDSARGADERESVSRVTGAPATGVRMHWLFFDERAAERLDEAGFAYDSTFGYNETVGFRAGTLQAFKPIGARRLLELPLTIMDTALFYPSRLGLTPEAARQTVLPLIDEAERHGGALTINWHDRSLAPERLWGGFYVSLVDELKRRGAWFPTAAQAASWFRQRRSAAFGPVRREGTSVRVTASADGHQAAPGLRLRVHAPRSRNGDRPAGAPGPTRFTDAPFQTALDAPVTL